MKEVHRDEKSQTSEARIEKEARRVQVLADLARGIFPPQDAPAPERRPRVPGQRVPRINPPYR